MTQEEYDLRILLLEKAIRILKGESNENVLP